MRLELFLIMLWAYFVPTFLWGASPEEQNNNEKITVSLDSIQLSNPIQILENSPSFSESSSTKSFSCVSWAMKTNGLYDLLLIPNIGVEVAFKQTWSVSSNWMYAWWSNNNYHNYWRIYGGNLELRYWLGKKAQEKPLQGHHFHRHRLPGGKISGIRS